MARIATYTDRGARATGNQDALCVRAATTSLGEVSMAVVCDGVGGLDWGEVASSSVAELFGRWFEEELPGWLARYASRDAASLGDLRDVWERLLLRANDRLVAAGRARGSQLGTTFTGVICLGGRFLVGHVGDCRAYLVGSERTRLLTQDQTMAAHDVSLGLMSEEEAERSQQRSVLLQAVGTQEGLQPVFSEGGYAEGDLFVLATDGAWRLPGSAGMDARFRPLRTASEDGLSRSCRELCFDDLARGERDNLTVVCLGPEASAGGPGSSDATASMRGGEAA